VDQRQELVDVERVSTREPQLGVYLLWLLFLYCDLFVLLEAGFVGGQDLLI